MDYERIVDDGEAVLDSIKEAISCGKGTKELNYIIEELEDLRYELEELLEPYQEKLAEDERKNQEYLEMEFRQGLL
jgi:predicted RNase H-like nuclease (RuvC/YqgF family)